MLNFRHAVLALLFSWTTFLEAASFHPVESDASDAHHHHHSGHSHSHLHGPAEESEKLTQDQALVIAQAMILKARKLDDPRFLDKAEEALNPWWNEDQPPGQVLILRATIHQSRHWFKAAERDLEKAIAEDPHSAQARLTLAGILRVAGQFEQATQHCHALIDSGVPIEAEICTASLESLTGDPALAIERMQQLEPRVRSASVSIAIWYHRELADMAARAGQAKLAEDAYQAAIRLQPDNRQILAEYSDLLLDQNRAKVVLTLTDELSTAPTLEYRRALAFHKMGSPKFAPLDKRISDAFAAARKRGDDLHLREALRYLLATGRGSEEELVDMALKNWALQKEPWDTRLVFMTAERANQAGITSAVNLWMKKTGYRDARLFH